MFSPSLKYIRMHKIYRQVPVCRLKLEGMLWIGIALVVCALILNFVGLRLRRQGMEARGPRPDPSSLDPLTRLEIDELVADGKTIHAIKRLREALPGLGLAEAKAHIDTWPRR